MEKKIRRQYDDIGTDCKSPCGVPRAGEAEEILCVMCFRDHQS